MNVAFIPVRGGSKSIPLKNIRRFAGQPLVFWTAKAASECEDIDAVYVATDSEQIAETVRSFRLPKVSVIGRSAASASDTASTEEAMLEFAAAFPADIIVLIQATSPLLRAEDLHRGFIAFQEADSVLSVVRQKRFVWRENGLAEPLNYDVNSRPRRQEFEGFLVENGAFYITSREALLRSRCRLSGKIRVVEMPEESYFEIDEPSDWTIMEELMRRRIRQGAAARKIRMFLTDCDGTLTDGGMYYSPAGEELKKFDTRDAAGLRRLQEHGIVTGILSGEDSMIVSKRAEKIGVDEVLLGVRDKKGAAEALCSRYGFTLGELAYVGDDLNDLELLQSAGLSFCPSDAQELVKNCVMTVLECPGGRGAVRLASEILLNHMEMKGI